MEQGLQALKSQESPRLVARVLTPGRCLTGALALALGIALGCVSAPGQPRMQAALDDLRGARSELDRADSDKGGHRAEAIRLVDQAIDEVRLGMEFARRR